MKIGMLGAGAMGQRMALRLLEAGHEVCVYGRSGVGEALVGRGAQVALTPAQAARGAAVVVAMVTDDEASRAVWLGDGGAAEGMAGEAVALEVSTISARWARELGAALGARGIALLDAPVMGSLPQVEAGALVQLVGGGSAALEIAQPVMAAWSARQIHVGGQGAGAALKLALNGIFAVQVAALAEALGALAEEGISPAAALAMMDALATTSPAMRAAGALIAAGEDRPLFPVRLVVKDLRYLLAMSGADAPLMAAACARYEQAQAAGLGERHLTAVSRL